MAEVQPATFAVTDPTTAGVVTNPVIAQRQPEAERLATARRQERYRLLCDQARHRLQVAEEFERSWRGYAIQDQQFAAGNQWDEAARRARDDPHHPRPCLTINQVPRFIRQITNDEQQNRPTIKIRPVDSVADPETAAVFDGLIRHIMYQSDFDVAEDTAFESAVRIGRGYWRILTDYESPWAFEQVIRIERILNPFEVYLDPLGRQHPDYHTANWGFVVARMPRDYLTERYEIPAHDWQTWMVQSATWVQQDEALVADYYYKEEMPVLLCQLENREVRYIAQMPAPEDMETEEEQTQEARLLEVVAWRMQRQGIYPLTEDETGQVRQQRQSMLPVIWQCKIVGTGILEAPSVWPGQFIPIVPVLGEELDLNGDVDYRGIVRDMMDSARAFNYWVTMAAETVALAPKAPWVGTIQQFQNFEHIWQSSNTTPRAYLPYNPHVVQQQVLPPPQRNVLEPPIQAIGYMIQQSSQNLYTTSGIQPADLGDPSNEKSGKHAAIRKAESELGTSNFKVHLMWALRHTGRVLIDLIPQIYHEPGRVLRILGKDQSESMAILQPGAQGGRLPGGQMPQLPPGVEHMADLSIGQYDLVVDTGPNYLTQRQEAAATLIDVASAIPQAANVIPDLIVGMQDFDGAEEAARRLKKTLPPELLDDDDKARQKPEEQVIVLTSQLQKTQQEAKALDAHAQELMQALQQAQQEATQLKQSQAVKMQELALKSREIDIDEREMQIKAAEALERAQLERAKLVLEQRREAHEAASTIVTVRQEMAQMEALLRKLAQGEREGAEAAVTQLATVRQELDAMEAQLARLMAQEAAEQEAAGAGGPGGAAGTPGEPGSPA